MFYYITSKAKEYGIELKKINTNDINIICTQSESSRHKLCEKLWRNKYKILDLNFFIFSLLYFLFDDNIVLCKNTQLAIAVINTKNIHIKKNNFTVKYDSTNLIDVF